MTYETYLEVLTKKDLLDDKGEIQQLQGFGQTPKQLFKTPHAFRRALKIVDKELLKDNTSDEMVQINAANLLRNEKKEKEFEKYRRAKDKELDKITLRFNEVTSKRNDTIKQIKE